MLRGSGRIGRLPDGVADRLRAAAARSGAYESAEVLAAEAMDMAPSGFLNLR